MTILIKFIDPQAGLRDNASDLCTGGVRFEPQASHIIPFAFLWLSSAPSEECRDNNLHYTQTASFHVLSDFFIVLQSLSQLECAAPAIFSKVQTSQRTKY